MFDRVDIPQRIVMLDDNIEIYKEALIYCMSNFCSRKQYSEYPSNNFQEKLDSNLLQLKNHGFEKMIENWKCTDQTVSISKLGHFDITINHESFEIDIGKKTSNGGYDFPENNKTIINFENNKPDIDHLARNLKKCLQNIMHH